MSDEEQIIFLKALYEDERVKNALLMEILLERVGILSQDQPVQIGPGADRQVISQSKSNWVKIRDRLEARYRIPSRTEIPPKEEDDASKVS